MKRILSFILIWMLPASLSVMMAWDNAPADLTKAFARGDKEAMAITPTGDLYVSGDQNSSSTIAGTTLKQGTHLIKYDKNGVAKWALPIAMKDGSRVTDSKATTLSMILDDEGNLYVAGIFKGEVTFGTTTGSVGNLDSGTYGFGDTKSGGFIAKYKATGELIKVIPFLSSAIVHTPENPNFADMQNPFFDIMKLQYANGKIYVMAMHSGTLTIDGVTIIGSYFNLFDFAYQQTISGSVFSVSKDLVVTDLIATATAEKPFLAINNDINSINFDVNGNDFYLAFAGIRDQKLVYKTGEKIFNFPTKIEGGETLSKQAIVLCKIDLTTGKLVNDKTFLTPQFLGPNRILTIKSMQQKEGMLYLGGNFEQELVFDQTKKYVGTKLGNASIYTTKLNTADFSASQSVVVGTGGNDEILGDSFDGNKISFYGSIITVNSKNEDIYEGFTYNTGDEIVKLASGTYMQGMVNNSSYNAKTMLTGTQISFSESTNTSVADIAGTSVTVGPNPTNDLLNFSENVTVTLFNNMGAQLLKAIDTPQISLEGLPSGIYFARISTATTTFTEKIIKK